MVTIVRFSEKLVIPIIWFWTRNHFQGLISKLAEKFQMSTSATRSAHVPGAKVIAYYADADGQFSTIKIGYDVDLFDEAVRKIPFGEIRTREEEPSKDVNDQLAANERNLNDLSIHQSNQPNEAPASKPQPIQIKKEDIQFVSTQLEVGAKVAENALKRAEGSLEDALLFLIRETTTTS